MFAQPSISNQTFRTSITKSSIFVRNKTIGAALTWAIVIHYFMRFAFWAGGSCTIWKWSFRTSLTLTIDIDNIIKCRTRLTFSSVGPLCLYSECLGHFFVNLFFKSTICCQRSKFLFFDGWWTNYTVAKVNFYSLAPKRPWKLAFILSIFYKQQNRKWTSLYIFNFSKSSLIFVP